LNAEALRNIPYILVTSLTLQSPSGWLNEEAPLNMEFMAVTPEVSHALMSSLKDVLDLNKSSMSVTPLVSHVLMWPYIASAAASSKTHAVTAVLFPPSERGLSAPVPSDMYENWAGVFVMY